MVSSVVRTWIQRKLRSGRTRIHAVHCAGSLIGMIGWLNLGLIIWHVLNSMLVRIHVLGRITGFTDPSNKFATTASPMQQKSASPGSGHGSILLNFSITCQSVLPEQLMAEGWSPKASNTFSEPLSLPETYAGKSLALEPGNPSLFGVDSGSGFFLPSTVPRFASSSGDAEASPMSLADSGFENSLYSCMQVTTHELLHGVGQINPSNQTKNFVKVYKSGSVGRSLDISRLSSYHELREELGKKLAIEGLLEDPLRSGWQLAFVDKENDILLLGDDPWESFVSNV